MNMLIEQCLVPVTRRSGDDQAESSPDENAHFGDKCTDWGRFECSGQQALTQNRRTKSLIMIAECEIES
jgi:hypothetical protein